MTQDSERPRAWQVDSVSNAGDDYNRSAITSDDPDSTKRVDMAPKLLLPEDDILVWNTLAMLYLVSGELERARNAVHTSLDFDSGQSSTWLLLGRILETDDDAVNAERAYRMSIELDSANRQALYNLALLRIQRGDVLGALEDLYRVVELTSSDQRAWDRMTECLQALVDHH